jgi:hypothetical protein
MTFEQAGCSLRFLSVPSGGPRYLVSRIQCRVLECSSPQQGTDGWKMSFGNKTNNATMKKVSMPAGDLGNTADKVVRGVMA